MANAIAQNDMMTTRPYCTLRLNGVKIARVLMDSGADQNIIGAEQLRKLTATSDDWQNAYLARNKDATRSMYGFDGSHATTLGTIDVSVAVKKEVERILTFDIAPVCNAGIIIGQPGMRELEFSLYSPLFGWNVLAGRENRLSETNDPPRNVRTYINRTLVPEDKIVIAARRRTVVQPRSEETISTMLVTSMKKEMRKCNCCGASTHPTRYCKWAICKYCREKGHIERDCYTKLKDKEARRRDDAWKRRRDSEARRRDDEWKRRRDSEARHRDDERKRRRDSEERHREDEQKWRRYSEEQRRENEQERHHERERAQIAKIAYKKCIEMFAEVAERALRKPRRSEERGRERVRDSGLREDRSRQSTPCSHTNKSRLYDRLRK
jgi:hypothetical protein